MNILKRKVQVKNYLPASYNSLPEHFIDAQEAIATYLENDLGFEIAAGQIRQEPELLGSECFDAHKVNITGLLFAFGEEYVDGLVQPECQIFLEVSPGLANAIITAKLCRKEKKTPGKKTPEKASDKTTGFTLFDVLIVQPLAERFLMQLRRTGAEGNLKLVERNISMNQLCRVRFAKQENWLKLHFPISLKENQTTPNQTSKKNGSSKSAAKNNDGLSFSLYLTQPIAENLLQAKQEKQNLRVIDPENPWSQHMRNTMLNACRPLEAVIEDLKLSVAECTRLELGQIIALPGASHEHLNIKTKGNNGTIILTTATLGAFKSSKAVKLNKDIDSVFLGESDLSE